MNNVSEKLDLLNNPPTEEEFRQAGFTGNAKNYPLSEAGCQWVADFNGTSKDKMPRSWRYAPNEYMHGWIEGIASGRSIWKKKTSK